MRLSGKQSRILALFQQKKQILNSWLKLGYKNIINLFTQSQSIKYKFLMRDSRSPQQSKRIYLKHFFSFYAPKIDTGRLQQSLLEGSQTKKSQYISDLNEKNKQQINLYLSSRDIKKIINCEFKQIDQDLQNQISRLFEGIKTEKDIEYLKLKILNGGYQQQVKHLKKILKKQQLKIVTDRIAQIQSRMNKSNNHLQKYMEYFRDMDLNEIDDRELFNTKLQQIIQSVLDVNVMNQQRIVSQLQDILTAEYLQIFQRCLSTLKQKRQQQIQQFTKERYQQQMRRNSQISRSFILPPPSSGSYSIEALRISSNQSSLHASNRIPSVIQPQFQVLNDDQLQLTIQIKKIINEIESILSYPIQNSYQSILFPNFYNYQKEQQQKRKQQFALNNDTYNYQLDEEYFQRFAEHRMKRTNRSQVLQLNYLTRIFLELFQASKLTASKLLFFVYQLSICQQSKRKQITDEILEYKRQSNKIQADNKNKVLQGLFNLKLQYFIYELIYYNLLKHSVSVSGSNSQGLTSFLQGSYQSLNQESKVIFRYYEVVLNNQIPFNMLSENSLAFGNIYAKKAMDKMKVILKDKKLFVISIIGTQSSAKSSLLNKLFQLGFKVSGGRCTIGINMILINKDKISILIIDSQGTSSRDREDINFDIRINTFIMLISDVLIINIKGELNRDQTQLINNCSFILSQLNKDAPLNEEKQGTFFGKPKRVIFALRDINDLSEANLQKQKLSIITYAQRSKNPLRQQLALGASQKDIFIFPNSKQNSNNFDTTIIKMRDSIMQQLKQGKYSTLLDFYTDSQKAWNILINLSADKLHQYKYEYMKKMKEQIQKQALKLQKQIGSKDCKEINAIYDSLKQYHDIKAIQQNERMLYEGLRLAIKEKGKRKWLEIQRLSLQKVEGVNMRQLTPILKLIFDNQMLNIQLKEEYRFKKQLQNYKRYKNRQIYVQKLKLQVKDKIREGYDRDNIIIYLDQKYKIQQSRKRQQIKKLDKISNDLHQQFNIKKIQYSDVLHVKKKYYFLREQIKKAISKLQPSASQMKVTKQIQQLQQIYNTLTNSATGELYIKQNLLISPDNNRNIYQMKSLDNKDIFYYIIDFLNTGTQIMEKVIDQFAFVDQSRDLEAFLQVIQNKLDAHYNQLKTKIQYFYDLDIKLTQSAIMEVQSIKLAPKTKYLKLLYSILPLKILLKTLKQQSQNIQFQIKSIHNVHETAKQELSYLDKTQFRLCRYWFKHFIQMIIKKSIKKAKLQIDKVINKSYITPQKITMDIFLSKIVTYDHKVTHQKQEYLELYKLFTNYDRYMIEWYRRTIFEKYIIKNIYRIIQKQKIKHIDEIQIFQAKVQNIYQTLNSEENLMKQKPIQYFYQLLFNNRTLFFPNFIQNSAKDIFSFFKVQIKLKQSQLKQIYAKQIIGYEKTLQDYYEQQLKRKIYPIIIGCPQKCPKCGVKCKLRSLHAGPHEVIQGTHYLYCFNPQNNRQKKQCDKTWCCNVGFRTLQRQYKFDNYHEQRMGWYKCFYHGGNFSQQSDQKETLKHIWAHIGPAALQARKLKGFLDKELKGLAKKPLKMSDLEKNNILDYHLDYFRK